MSDTHTPVESAPTKRCFHCEAVGNAHLPYLHPPSRQLASLNFELAASKTEALCRLKRGGEKMVKGREREEVMKERTGIEGDKVGDSVRDGELVTSCDSSQGTTLSLKKVV